MRKKSTANAADLSPNVLHRTFEGCGSRTTSSSFSSQCSCGGNVITNAVPGHDNVKALAYVSAFAPDVGESAADLAGKSPGSTLGSALAPPVKLAIGANDPYILQDRFHDQFAADVPPSEAALMTVTQRPIEVVALNEKSANAVWKALPSWFLYGDMDKNIPPSAIQFMSERAHEK